MCFIDYKKAFDCVDHDRMWISLKEMGASTYVSIIEKHARKSESGSQNSVWRERIVRHRERWATCLHPVFFDIPHLDRANNERTTNRHRRKSCNECELRG